MSVGTTTTNGPSEGGQTFSAADIRPLRHRLGLTRAELAGRTGVSLSMLANLEAGAVPRRSRALEQVLATLRRLAAGLDENEGPTAL